MKLQRIGLVAGREFLTTVSRKGFIIGLLLTPVMIVLFAVLGPRILGSRSPQVSGIVHVVDPTGMVLGELRERLAPEAIARRRDESRRRAAERMAPGMGAAAETRRGPPVPALTLQEAAASEVEDARSQLAQRDRTPPVLAVVLLHPDAVARPAAGGEYGGYELYASPRLDEGTENVLHEGLRLALVGARMEAGGLDAASVEAAMRVDRPRTMIVADAGAQQSRRGFNRMLPFLMGMLLFVGVITGGQTLMTSTIEEKSSRVVEVLLAAVSPLELMWGKLLGQLAVGLLVLAVYVGLGLLSLLQFALFGLVDLSLVLWLFVFFLLAYLFFGSLMLSIGAAVNQAADAQSLMGPVMLLMIAPYVLTPVVGQAPNSLVSVTASFLPPFNSFVMLARLASTTPPPVWQPLLSVAIGLLAAAGVVWCSAKIFRVGLLMHGKPPSFGTLLRWVRMAVVAAVAVGVAGLPGTVRAAAPANEGVRLAALEQRATRLADIAEIKRLQAIYGYYIDHSQWDDVVDLLTDDVTLEYGSSGVYVGKAKARALLYGIGYGQKGLLKGQLREHTQLQPVITLAPDGRTAQGRWHALVLLGQFQQYARWQTGPYENEYRKENGRWKISRLHWFETFTVPYAGGWTTSMPSSNVADRRLPPPDRPPSVRYEPWPAVFVPPYHYGNPAAAPAPRPAAPAAAGNAPEDPARAAALVRAVERLEDERDIQNLQRTYGYYVDKNLWSEVATLFAEDGTLEIGGRGVFVGRKRVLQYLQFLGKPERGWLYDHTQMQPVVHVSPDGRTARGRWRALIFVAGGGAERMGDAIYENEYRKEDGRWKISRLHAWFIMYADVKQGWKDSAVPNTRPEKDMPPDRPPTVVYDMYPGTLTAPYHYENPVTGRPVFAASPGAAPAAGAKVDVAAMEARIARLEDAEAIERLQNVYGFYTSKRQWDEVARLFSRDGTLEIGQRGVYVGPQRIRRALELDGPQGLQRGDFNDHIQYQQVTHVAPDGLTARARVRELALTGRYGGTAMIGGGTAENEYVKEDGTWKIRSLHLFTRFNAEYEKGWIEGARPAPGQSRELPPDRPPTVRYEAFPAFHVPPLHYPNPVTGRRIEEAR